jgi:hypothetical protein
MIIIKTKPNESTLKCPSCDVHGSHIEYVFHGIHTSEKFTCKKCKHYFIIDLPIGYSTNCSFQYNVKTRDCRYSNKGAYSWFIKPYLKSLSNPSLKFIKIRHIKRRKAKNPLILNCMDYLYGHVLLKLLNIERHLKDNKNLDLVIIIPKSFLWLVPNGVAEIITIDVSLSQALNYYPSISSEINKYISKYDNVHLSKAGFYPEVSDISIYTKQQSCIKTNYPRISFIWREDRPWINNMYLVYLFKKLKVINILNYVQYLKVISLFKKLKKTNKDYTYTVTGFGKRFNFPKWIKDGRTKDFTVEKERELCKIYSESEIVIGIHGSSMLLPSAHAKMTLNLMPMDRLENFAQDIIYEKKRFNHKLSPIFTHRFLFLNNSISTIAKMANLMIKDSCRIKKKR